MTIFSLVAPEVSSTCQVKTTPFEDTPLIGLTLTNGGEVSKVGGGDRAGVDVALGVASKIGVAVGDGVTVGVGVAMIKFARS